MDAAEAKHEATALFDNNSLRARQAVLPSNVSSQLDTTNLPMVQLKEHEFVDSILCRRSRHASIQVLHATDGNATKLLMTPMRDVTVAGPVRVGRYLIWRPSSWTT